MSDVRRPTISTDRRNRLAFWALAGAALFVAHDAIYLAQVGPGQSLAAVLRTAGHGYWAWASLALALAAIVAGTWAWIRMRRLRRRARALGTSPAARPFTRRFAASWWRLAAVVAIGFVFQENVEHLAVHGHAPGLEALIGPEQPLALPVIGLISALAAAVAALVMRAHEALVVAIEAALRRPIRPPRVTVRPPARLLAAIGSVLAGQGAGRAPPAVVVSAT
jgi:hypothetical protein